MPGPRVYARACHCAWYSSVHLRPFNTLAVIFNLQVNYLPTLWRVNAPVLIYSSISVFHSSSLEATSQLAAETVKSIRWYVTPLQVVLFRLNSSQINPTFSYSCR